MIIDLFFVDFYDVIVNLLIRDIRILDGQNKCNTYTAQYEQFLNNKCKVQFKFQKDKIVYLLMLIAKNHVLLNAYLFKLNIINN